MCAAVSPAASTRRGFAAIDAVASLAALTLLAALLLAGASATRHHASAAGTQAQLRWIAGVTQSYAADNQDKLWGLSWSVATTPGAESEIEAAAMQVRDIVHRRHNPDFIISPGWFSTQWYSHMPLADYLDLDLPLLEFVSPEDAVRLPWARDPEGFYRGAYLPLQPDPIPYLRRWIYSASYQTAPHMSWDPLSGEDAVRHATTHTTFTFGETTRITQRRLADFAFPAQKVHAHAGEQFAPQRIYFGDPAAQVPMLMADGSAAVNRTADANLGWDPLVPTNLSAYVRYRYDQRTWEAPAPSFEPGDLLPGRYRFTRGGPAGRDFGGPEIDTRE